MSLTPLPWSLVSFGIACIVLAAGSCALLLAALRKGDLLLICLGAFSLLYGVRLALDNDLVFHALGTSSDGVALWRICITFVIPIPYAIFAVELLGKGWRRSIQIFLWAEAVFAALAVPVSLLAHRVGLWLDVNNWLISAGTIILLLHVIFGRKREDAFTRSLSGPLIVFALSVLAENQRFQPGGVNLEPFGFLVLLAGLGYTALARVLISERTLAEVQQELSTARRIQSSIIPQSAPKLDSLVIASRYQPMTSVAGDFFDFLQSSEHQLTVLVADVSGHGVPAALVASMLKVCFAALRAHAANPAEILAGLNLMLRDSLGGQYVTASCAAIDVEAQRITYAGAGHPPALLFQHASDSVVPLEENGLFIGPFPQAQYANLSAAFQRGDRLLLYTDGIIEALITDGSEFGKERLTDFLRAGTGLTPAELVDRLCQRIYSPAQQDDQTVVLVQFV